MRKTHLLNDDPASTDEFGTHARIAQLIRHEVLDAEEGRSIALVGDWGSGKSTIIELIKRDFVEKDRTVHLFIYDAWAHQGDQLRRSFLDDFIASMAGSIGAKAKDLSEKIWNRTEVTTTLKEPLLRRHAKILLLSLLLIPLGLRLFDSPKNASSLDILTKNFGSISLILAPLLLAILLSTIKFLGFTRANQFLFGDDYKHPGFSVLSFFVEKVHGQTERKHTKTPTDSIKEFREIFSETIDSALQRMPETRIVIVIDNIDRIPADQAREFWSTMQTFFADGGGLRRPNTRKYWLIAPFSEQALSFVFKDSESKTSADANKDSPISQVRAYVDKTFSLAFYVPPPILTNWRRYLLSKLEEAFPEHEIASLAGVRDAFDFSNNDLRNVTPRQIKLFVNSLVAVYRQRGDTISLAAIALYVLHRDKFATSPNEEFLTAPARRLIEETNWRTAFAALHYGVPLDEGNQILLHEPITTALRESDRERLKVLETQSGFSHVLDRVLATELEASSADDASTICRFAWTLGGLSNAAAIELAYTWRRLGLRMKRAKSWEEVHGSSASGITTLLQYTREDAREELRTAIAKYLSSANIAPPDAESHIPTTVAEQWTAASIATIEGAVGVPPRIALPGGTYVKLELTQTILESQSGKSTRAQFNLGVSSEELTKAIDNEVKAGRYLRRPIDLVNLLSEWKCVPNWKVVVDACAVRLREPSLQPGEVEGQISTILAAFKVAELANAQAILKELSVQGYISHYVYQNRPRPAICAKLICAVAFANPRLERPTQWQNSQPGDEYITQFLSNPSSNEQIVQHSSELVGTLNAHTDFFLAGAHNSNASNFVAQTFAYMLSRPENKIDIDPALIFDQREFLRTQSPHLSSAVFLKRLSRLDQLLENISAQPFDLNCCHLYASILELLKEQNHPGVATRIEVGLQSLDQPHMLKCIELNKYPFSEAFNLATACREINPDFVLSTSARDAALEAMRKAAKGQLEAPEARAKLTTATSLLPVSLQRSLTSDIIDDMAASADPVRLVRIVDAFGQMISLDHQREPERIVRRILSPLLSNLTEKSANWIVAMTEKRSTWAGSLPEGARSEFQERLRATIEKGSEDPKVSEALGTLANLWELGALGSEVRPSNSSGA